MFSPYFSFFSILKSLPGNIKNAIGQIGENWIIAIFMILNSPIYECVISLDLFSTPLISLNEIAHFLSRRRATFVRFIFKYFIFSGSILNVSSLYVF